MDKPLKTTKRYRYKITDEQLPEVLELAKTQKLTDIAKKYGVNPSTIGMIVSFQKRWPALKKLRQNLKYSR